MPNTRNWYAFIDHIPVPGKPFTLYVRGEVQVAGSDETPVLRKAFPPQGAKPHYLYLSLAIEGGGDGKPPTQWRSAEYEQKTAPGEFSSVDISVDGESIVQVGINLPD